MRKRLARGPGWECKSARAAESAQVSRCRRASAASLALPATKQGGPLAPRARSHQQTAPATPGSPVEAAECCTCRSAAKQAGCRSGLSRCVMKLCATPQNSQAVSPLNPKKKKKTARSCELQRQGPGGQRDAQGKALAGARRLQESPKHSLAIHSVQSTETRVLSVRVLAPGGARFPASLSLQLGRGLGLGRGVVGRQPDGFCTATKRPKPFAGDLWSGSVLGTAQVG